MKNKPNKALGFTIFEMMIAVAVLGVFLAIAVPNFNDFIEKQKVRSDASAVAKALSYARAEALVLSSQSTKVVFATEDETITDSSNRDQDLKAGYLAVMDAGTMEFLTVVNYRQSQSLSAHNDDDGEITFNALGGLGEASSLPFSMIFCGSTSAEKYALQVDVSQTGRVSQKKKQSGLGARACP